MPTIHDLTGAYVAGVETLRKAVAGLTREQLLARPILGKMSTLEVVAHVADFEPILADRMKRVIALDDPPLLAADENLFRARLAYHDRDIEEELQIVALTRSSLARILRTLPESALARTGVHSERGPKMLAEILTGATNHITHHVPFIYEKRKALGLPG